MRTARDASVARPLTVPLLLATLVLATVMVEPANAIPAFARRYGTSCQTCHVAYPKLNAFGEAFRQLGYHMPGETEAQVKQPDVPLGSEAYKRVWPRAVWPGMIPAHLPVAMTAEFLARDSSQGEGDATEKIHNDFVFPSEVALIAGGSAGENISYFGELGIEREAEDGEIVTDVELEHMDVRFIRPIHNSTAFNVKVGAFQPELVSAFDHARRLTLANYDSMFGVSVANPGGAEAVGGGHHGGGAGIALPAITTGIELFGVAHHRLTWAAGLVNGLGPKEGAFDGNSAKDVYGRIAYKWGGLDLDGANAATFAGSDKNWREQSFRLGIFGYQGDGKGQLSALAAEEHAEILSASSRFLFAVGRPQEEESDEHEAAFVETRTFTRAGIDFSWFYNDLNVFGAYVRGRDDLRAFAADHMDASMPGELLHHLSGEFTYKAWFLEADAVLGYPWLHGAARYEWVDLPSAEADTWERATLSVTALVRANVKTTAEYSWDLNESANHSAQVSLAIAF